MDNMKEILATTKETFEVAIQCMGFAAYLKHNNDALDLPSEDVITTAMAMVLSAFPVFEGKRPNKDDADKETEKALADIERRSDNWERLITVHKD